MVQTSVMVHGILAAAAQSKSSGGTNWHDVAETWQAILTAAAIILGGLFTYYKFFKDRVYRPRINIKVDAGHVEIGLLHFLMCRVTMENKGSTKLEILRDRSAILCFQGTPGGPFTMTKWGSDAATTVLIFQKHGWFESGEMISDDALIAIPADDDHVYRLRYRLVISDATPWHKGNIEINGVTTVLPSQVWTEHESVDERSER